MFFYRSSCGCNSAFHYVEKYETGSLVDIGWVVSKIAITLTVKRYCWGQRVLERRQTNFQKFRIIMTVERDSGHLKMSIQNTSNQFSWLPSQFDCQRVDHKFNRLNWQRRSANTAMRKPLLSNSKWKAVSGHFLCFLAPYRNPDRNLDFKIC